MRARCLFSAFVVLMILVALPSPGALAASVAVRPPSSLAVQFGLDSAGQPGAVVVASTSVSSDASQGACFGYNHVNDSFIPEIVGSLRIAVVEPILTSTPYSYYEGVSPTGSFYAFYDDEQGVNTTVTANLDLLSTNLSSGYGYNGGWGLSYGLYEFLTSQAAVNCGLVIGKNVNVLTDMDVSEGALFYSQNQTARYDVVILPFSEYVTAQEYLAYEDFVARGGTLLMDGHSLEYPVTYTATTNMETLVYGHGWAFNGTYASPIACSSNNYAACPWSASNNDWVGSNTCEASCFHNYIFNGSVVNPKDILGRALSNEFGGTVFKSYVSHEENTLTNKTGTSVVSIFANDSRNLITAYTHQFKKGSVVCMCVFGDDIIRSDQSAQYFMLLGIVSGRLGPAATCSSVGASSGSTCSLAVVGWNPTGTVFWTQGASPSFSPQTCTLVSGSCSVRVLGAGSGPFSAILTYSGDSLNAPSTRAVTLFASSPKSVSSTTALTASTTSSSTHEIGLIAVGGLAAVGVACGVVALRGRRKRISP